MACMTYFYPFGLRVDWSESKLSYAPEILVDRQPIVGADTDALYNAKYGARGLTIVAYSADGFTKTQIEHLKTFISNNLADAYKKSAKLTYYDTGYVNINLSGITFADNIQTGFLKVTLSFTLVNRVIVNQRLIFAFLNNNRHRAINFAPQILFVSMSLRNLGSLQIYCC